MSRSLIYVLTVLIISFNSVAKEVRYPNFADIGSSSLGYAVLNLALTKSGKDY